jgi:small subunit ribosomal protein S21
MLGIAGRKLFVPQTRTKLRFSASPVPAGSTTFAEIMHSDTAPPATLRIQRRELASRQNEPPALLCVGIKRNGWNVQVLVRDNNVDQALRALKKKLQREGVFREMKLRNFYEKPSEKRAREKAEAVRRARKLARKRAQREGLLPVKGRGK